MRAVLLVLGQRYRTYQAKYFAVVKIQFLVKIYMAATDYASEI